MSKTSETQRAAGLRAQSAANTSFDALGPDVLGVIVIVIDDDADAAVAYAGDRDLAGLIPTILRQVADANRLHTIVGHDPGAGEANE